MSIQDHWDQEEEEIYANNSVLTLYLRPEQVMTFSIDRAAFATCIFIPDRSDYNSSLALAFSMLGKMKDCQQEGGKVVSVAYEINGFGAFAILLFDRGYQNVYKKAKERAEEHPALHAEPCFHTPVSMTPDTAAVPSKKAALAPLGFSQQLEKSRTHQP
ncbi:uncharacterized protein EV420DRAFT_1472657 [Desarmillaria tabescens]|uniref:Uncharacterized protein n=1 Tax=Armillaria tabescens TaxID=1929756 RepID=A0AA39U2M0_ARMTA|nr:uncharacterized protein EV420DRAFT_1472657 [Desarmillaria tabescens]KAK0469424.1 hypothetical protein EV420DRAFT_1472657 [Desarmillaria tabescens]